MKIFGIVIISEDRLWSIIILHLYDMLDKFRNDLLKAEFPEDLDISDYAREYTNTIADKLK